MPRTLQDTALGLRLAASSGVAKKGIFILAPMVGNKRKKGETEKTEQDTAANETQRMLYGFRSVYVFDISQTEGKDLPALTEVNGDVSGYRERLFKFVESQSVELSFSSYIAGTTYVPVFRTFLASALASALICSRYSRTASPNSIRTDSTSAESVAALAFSHRCLSRSSEGEVTQHFDYNCIRRVYCSFF
jgi:hypothetical protein